jgi:hypothetical protein
VYGEYLAARWISLHAQPRAASACVLPMFDAQLRVGHAQVYALKFARAADRWRRLVEHELA